MAANALHPIFQGILAAQLRKMPNVKEILGDVPDLKLESICEETVPESEIGKAAREEYRNRLGKEFEEPCPHDAIHADNYGAICMVCGAAVNSHEVLLPGERFGEVL